MAFLKSFNSYKTVVWVCIILTTYTLSDELPHSLVGNTLRIYITALTLGLFAFWVAAELSVFEKSLTPDTQPLSTVENHIDEFIDDWDEDPYARWFFFLKRLPAAKQMEFAEFIMPIELYCDYDNRRYRVTGCSRLGDVWLTTNFALAGGHVLRVDVKKCSRWKPHA